MLQILSLLLVIAALCHVWLQLYNRRLITIPDGPWKSPIHQASLALLVVGPAFVLFTTRHMEPVDEALSWAPHSQEAKAIFAGFGLLWLLMAWRFALWALDRAWPPRSHHILSQTVSAPRIEKPPPRLPPPFQRLETTFDLEAVEMELSIPCLPRGFDGLTIAHVSDIHFDPRKGWMIYYGAVAEAVKRWDADVVAFTGDFVNQRRFISSSVRYHGLMKGRLATLAVLGNHDYWTNARQVREACAAAGIRLMHNNRWVIERHGSRLVFAGTDAPWGGQRSDLPNLLAHGTLDAAILLSHTPDNAPEAAECGANLVLSGHNHGGQYCLPGIGPIVVPSRSGHRFVEGVHDLGEDCVLSVSRGVGCSFVQRGGRTLSRPQVLLYTLRCEPVEQQIAELEARSRTSAALRPATGEHPAAGRSCYRKFRLGKHLPSR